MTISIPKSRFPNDTNYNSYNPDWDICFRLQKHEINTRGNQNFKRLVNIARIQHPNDPIAASSYITKSLRHDKRNVFVVHAGKLHIMSISEFNNYLRQYFQKYPTKQQSKLAPDICSISTDLLPPSSTKWQHNKEWEALSTQLLKAPMPRNGYSQDWSHLTKTASALGR